MLSIKDYMRKILWKVKLRKTLPPAVINSVKIKENNEELFNLRDDNSFFFSDRLDEQKEILVRKSVYDRLKKAQTILPPHYHFKIYSAYRSLEKQIAIWNSHYLEMKKKHPQLSNNDIIQLTQSVCARPHNGGGGHQTGGAVDLSLCDDNGVDYDMGTKISEIKEKTPSYSKGLSDSQRFNRKLLIYCMKKAGFQNYPNEWWHYAYGDRLVGHSGQFIHPKHQKKGIISETKAVMVDFMYKHLKNENPFPENAVFYTTCDQLNTGSQRLQEKSGARFQGIQKNKLIFYATQEEIMSSRLLNQRSISWTARLDNGLVISSMTGKNYPLQKKNPYTDIFKPSNSYYF